MFAPCKGFFLVFVVVVFLSSLQNHFGFITVMLMLASEQTWTLKTSSEL